MSNITVAELEQVIQMTKGQMIIYENAEMDTVRRYMFKGEHVNESDVIGRRVVDNILWGEKHMIVTLKEEEKRTCHTCQHQCKGGWWTAAGDYVTHCTNCHDFDKWTTKEEETTNA